ncbi:MAG: hypothetical protein ACYDBY_13525 [Thermoanaerobaculia bacterium]
MRRLLARPLGITALAFALLVPLGAMAQKAPPNEVTKAEHFLKKLEDHARRARGAAFKPGYEDNEALKRIKELKEKYPEDPAVEALFARARAALMGSKGDFIEITPGMLAYRRNEEKLRDLFGAEGEKERAGFLRMPAMSNAIRPAFPAPSIEDASADALRGRHVVLENARYPDNEFVEGGQPYLFVGSIATGFYWVELGGRSWIGVYEALKRYRRLVNADLPEQVSLTIVGKVKGVRLLVPQAEKRKTQPPQWGWVVEPVAIHVPGLTFTRADASQTGGSFAGEARLEQMKGSLYTVRSLPPGATPEQVVETFATAIKEKNLPLYLECISPERQAGPRARDLLMYHWDLHQFRFSKLYVHATVEPAVVTVRKGYDSGNDLESFFLTDEQKQTVAKISEELVEDAELRTKAWDERGRQYGSPKPRFLKRTGGAKGRWYITNFEQPF